jgi:formylglycine-generating enzyme required for sulfatase activity
MAHIPAATFMMGSPDGVGGVDEHPEHRVSLPGYCVDRTEVTVAEYAECVVAGACSPAAEPGSDGISTLCNGNRADRQNHPVNCVDWDQAKAYCTFVNRRLLSEAEWEYAARGPDRRMYPWGDDPPSSAQLNAYGGECRALAVRLKFEWSVMYNHDDQWEATAPVGHFPGDASPFGLLDMAGNVSEWTADWYVGYTPDGSPGVAETNQLGPRHVLRGGAWTTAAVLGARAASRDKKESMTRSVDLGLRCGRAE